jgi:outer membrane receptor protein involved in Fe transport
MLTKSSVEKLRSLAWAVGFSLLSCAPLSQAQEEVPGPVIEEVVVTAAKRSGLLQSTAMSLAVVAEEDIRKRGLVGMNDYLRSTPGVSMQDRGAGQNAVIMRGIAADPQLDSSSVGVYYGEVPITGLGGMFPGNPDIKMVDINHVEILRGPQGTLFGAGSMSGTVRIIPNRPNMAELEGEIATSYSATDGDANTMFQGVLNVPLITDSLAVRGSIYHYDNSGFYKNIAASDPVKSSSLGATLGAGVNDRDNMGSDEYAGGRIAVAWQPTDQLYLSASYFRQDINQEGIPDGSIVLGKFEQTRFDTPAGAESNDQNIEIINLDLNYDLDRFTLFMTSSWIDADAKINRDVGTFFVAPFGGDIPLIATDFVDSDVFLVEARITTNLDGPLQGLLGFYYEDSDYQQHQSLIWGGTPELDPFGGLLIDDGRLHGDGAAKAVFGELTYAFRNHLDVTAGFRYFNYDDGFSWLGTGEFGGGSLAASANDDHTTYKLNISYTTDAGDLYYAEVQEGYRAGSPGYEVPGVCDLNNDGMVDGVGTTGQPALRPDDLTSYEVGSKLRLMDGHLLLRGAAYYTLWQGMPVGRVADCGLIVFLNAGESMSKGFEVEGKALLAENWRVEFGFSYTNVELTEDNPWLGDKGDPLPGTPGYLFTVGAEYRFPVMNREAFARLDWVYVDDYYNNITREGDAIGGYHELGLAAGVNVNNVLMQLFVHNATDSDKVLWNDTNHGDGRVQRQRPRTVGLTARYLF